MALGGECRHVQAEQPQEDTEDTEDIEAAAW